MKKIFFVIFFTINPLCYEAIEFQEIRLPASKHYPRTKKIEEEYSVLDSKPLHIVFEDFYAKTIECWTPKWFNFDRHAEDFFIKDRQSTVIRIDEITSDMSTKWKCVLLNYNESKTEYTFNIRIKAAREVSVYIDRTLLKFKKTNESVLEYDGVNEYLCEEGVPINLDCQNPFTDGSLILKYYNANGTKMIETDLVDKVKDLEDKLTFRMLMSPDAHNSYVECTYLTAAAVDHKNYQQEFTYRIIFIIDKDPVKNEYFTITINNMKLKPKPEKVNGRDIYNYDFVYGENLTVTCEKNDKDMLGEIVMGTKLNYTMRGNDTIIISVLQKTQSIYKLLVQPTYLHQGQMEFTVFNSESNEYLNAMINFYAGSYGEFQEIRLAASKHHLKTKNVEEEYLVLDSKPLHIGFEDFFAKTVKCWTPKWFHFDRHAENFFINDRQSTVIRIDEITSDMSTKWKCVLTKYNKSKTEYTFNIRIKAAKEVSVYIDRTLLKFMKTNESVLEYDGVNEYLCEEGVTINLDCKNPFTDGSLILKYYNANGTKVIETDLVDNVKDLEDKLTFRMLMSPDAHKSYVECTYLTAAAVDHTNYQQEFTYRIIFIIDKDPIKNDDLIITVNGMELKSSSIESQDNGEYKAIYRYQYKFIYSSTLNITFEHKNKDIIFDIPKIRSVTTDLVVSDFKQTQSLYSPNVQVYLVDTKNLYETTMKLNFRTLDKLDTYQAEIKFLMDDHDDPAILGLSQSNILYQYNRNVAEWIIHYQYMVNEVLKLTCVVRNVKYLQWIYGDNIVLPILQNYAYGTSYVSYEFHTDTRTNETITCVTKSERNGTRKATIILHEIPDLSSHHNNDTDILEIGILPERKSKAVEIIGIIVGLLLALMSAFCCWRVKQRAQANRKRKLARNAREDNNRADDCTVQTASPEYADIEYNDTTHPDALTTNQGSNTSIRAPAPPPRNTRFQKPPRVGISNWKMVQSRRSNNDDSCGPSNNHRSGLECTLIEQEYDYAYGVKNKCPCVVPSSRGARKPRAKVPDQE